MGKKNHDILSTSALRNDPLSGCRTSPCECLEGPQSGKLLTRILRQQYADGSVESQTQRAICTSAIKQ